MSDDNDLPVLEVDVAEMAPEDMFRKLLQEASELVVSDLFFATEEKDVTVTVRHLGIVKGMARLSVDEGTRLIRHVKAQAGMDIAERRRPLDGRWLFVREDGKKVDLRINSVPTLHGEDLSIRLLDRETHLYSIESLGMMQFQFNDLLAMLSSPSGLILVTGPTGAGKTTTLYACIQHLNDGKRKINTIEDPIEYALEGVRQSQVNPILNVDFPDLLRAILRQSPDVIMIGEIRDRLTAETAVRAANSGHLVFATLHAPVASRAIQSMLSLGAHPHFLSTSLLGVLSQRLVRTLCPKCKVKIDLSDSPETFLEVDRWLGPGEGGAMYGPGKCDECRHEGYAGRTAVFEVLKPSRQIRRMIAEGRSGSEIENRAVEEGMVEFRRAALVTVAKGSTSIEEVFRAIPTEHLGLDL
jgi:type II secretory ATPase GspE/PulE/Tfp pilus assembly ATPase PilB-like protein